MNEMLNAVLGGDGYCSVNGGSVVLALVASDDLA